MLTQLTTSFLIGIYCGYLWLAPVFGVPTNEIFSDFLSPDRVLRILAPLMVWLLVVSQKNNKFVQLSREILTDLILAMCVFPAVGIILSGKLSSVISSVIPLMISLLVIIGLSILEDEIFFLFVLGISFSSLLFLTDGIIFTGLESNLFYGRARSSLGFVHPLQTGAAILGSMMFTYLVSYYVLEIKKVKNKFTRLFVYFSLVILSLFFFYLLWIADSKNTIIMIFIMFLCTLLCQTNVVRSLLLTSLGSAISMLYIVSMLKFYSDDIDIFSSFRFSIYNQNLNQFFSSISSDFLQLFIGLSSQKSDGFASTESVYISFLLNYGLISFISFIKLLTSVGIKLCVNQTSILPFGCFCGILFFFTFDAQGINTSNLSVFLIFAYSIRVALRKK